MPTIDPDPPQAEAPAAPRMPSFDSLRDPRRRSAIDVLVPIPADPPPAPPVPSASAPRPPDYTDLLRLGQHLAGVAVGVPIRWVRWSAGIPVRGIRRLLGR